MKTLRRTLWAIWILAMVLAQPAYADETIAHDLTVSVHSKQPDPAGVDENATVVFDLNPFKPVPPQGESVDSKWKHQRFYLTTKAAGAGEGDDGVISSVTVGVATVTREQAPKVVGIYTVSWPAANVVQIMQTGHSAPGCGVCTPQEMVRQMGLVAVFAEPGKKLVACRGGIDHDKWVPPQPDDPIVRVDKYTDTKTGEVLKTEEKPVWGACRTELFVLKIEVKNPCDANGDGKINDDANAGNNYTGNEFTYSTCSTWQECNLENPPPGVLTIPVRVEITPDTPEVRAEVQDKVRIRIDAINDSHGAGQNVTLVWDNPWPGEATAGKGVYNAETKTWNATATFTKLPPMNDDFGKKTVTAEIVDGVSDEVEIEVFWPLLRDPLGLRNNYNYALNNPEHGGAMHFRPNWFVYWLQTVALVGDPLPTVYYSDSTNYDIGQGKISIGSDCCKSKDKEYVTSNPLQGIDLFAWALIHECQHHVDWCTWWGVNYTYAEYQQDREGKTGAANDLDSDFVPNGVEDADGDGQYDEGGEQYDWQTKNTVPEPPRAGSIDNDWDERICRQHKDARGDHAKDWGNPGMNHGTEGKYDD